MSFPWDDWANWEHRPIPESMPVPRREFHVEFTSTWAAYSVTGKDGTDRINLLQSSLFFNWKLQYKTDLQCAVHTRVIPPLERWRELELYSECGTGQDPVSEHQNNNNKSMHICACVKYISITSKQTNKAPKSHALHKDRKTFQGMHY